MTSLGTCVLTVHEELLYVICGEGSDGDGDGERGHWSRGAFTLPHILYATMPTCSACRQDCLQRSCSKCFVCHDESTRPDFLRLQNSVLRVASNN